MFKRLIEMIKEALRKFINYDDVGSTLSEGCTIAISERMQQAIDLWRDIYKDEAPWLNYSQGIYSLGLGKAICQLLQLTVLAEMNTNIVTPGEKPNYDALNDYTKIKTRADFLDYVYQNKLVKKLPQNLEKAMALGGMVIKPYVHNDTVYFDFVLQGDFLPLEFDDDGTITDMAFVDQFISGGKQFTRVERQTFKNNQVIITNKAFVAKVVENSDDEQDLGLEVALNTIPKWSMLTEEPVIIENVTRPLYGYYKVPTANNVDMNSPLGASVYNSAVSLMERADMQFSRLDWEYNGGQIAIDVDVTAVQPENTYFNNSVQDTTTSRLYRKLDLGTEDTYKAFAPQLRDNNYIGGLNSYLNRIEDQCGLARGTLADAPAEARTATEISIVKQRSYITASSNQDALEEAIRDAVYSANVYVDLYSLAPDGEYALNIEWQDNILTDTQTELEQKLELEREGILSKAEIRAWYNGEDLESAKAAISEIEDEEVSKMINDVYHQKNNENTLEGNEPSEPNEDNVTEPIEE